MKEDYDLLMDFTRWLKFTKMEVSEKSIHIYLQTLEYNVFRGYIKKEN